MGAGTAGPDGPGGPRERPFSTALHVPHATVAWTAAALAATGTSAAGVPGAADSARAYIERSLELNPHQPDPHTNLGTLLEMDGRLEEARQEFLLAADLDPRSPDPLYNLGNLEASRGRSSEAIRRYRQSLERDPGHLPSTVNLASLLITEGKYEEASVFLERAEASTSHSREVRAAIERLRSAAKHRARLEPPKPEATGTMP